jgi:hypothetical protein
VHRQALRWVWYEANDFSEIIWVCNTTSSTESLHSESDGVEDERRLFVALERLCLAAIVGTFISKKLILNKATPRSGHCLSVYGRGRFCNHATGSSVDFG